MALTYIGEGTAIPGVPARDLNDEEEALYSDHIKEQQMHAGRTLYEPAKAKSSTRPQKDDSAQEGKKN